jgi:hypothetical protein
VSNTEINNEICFNENNEVIKATYGKIKFYPMGAFPTDTWIYKDNILIVTYTANHPIAVLITGKETANSYKKIFEGYWKNARG